MNSTPQEDIETFKGMRAKFEALKEQCDDSPEEKRIAKVIQDFIDTLNKKIVEFSSLPPTK